MRELRFYISIIFARLSHMFLKLTKLSSGTAIIGYFVLKICPEFLSIANKYITKSKINITGTNGKTTTSAVIAHILKNSGKNIIYNSTGANMLNGVVNSISLQINPFKKSEFAVIESDEAFLGKIYDKFDSDYLLVTNLFEDQLDRYGSLEGTKSLIQNAIDKKPDLQLILNADDPFVATMKANKPAIYYGITDVEYAESNTQNLKDENFKCACGKDLIYVKRFYSKIGNYYCNCGFARPDTKYNAQVKIFKNRCEIYLDGETYSAPVMGLFNAYNVLGAIVMLLENGISSSDIKSNLETFRVFSGRCEYKVLNGHKTLVQLIKNPVGATEVMRTVDLDSNIFIAINDNEADGCDSSWINDAEFEILKDAKKEIVVSGIRADEMLKRLEKAGCKNVKIINNIKNAVDYISKTADNNITMLPNYTALMEVEKTKLLK